MKEANGLIGMVKYAAERSGSKYVIGREGWKTMIEDLRKEPARWRSLL